MNDLIRLLTTRRSVRAYTGEPVCDADRDQILAAALQAPSGMNRQQYQFTVVTGESLSLLAEEVAKALNAPDYSRFYHAPMLILTSAPKSGPLSQDDCACAMENIMLAAHALDLGSVWINQLRDVCDDAGVRALLTRFGVPEDHACFGAAAVGHPAAVQGKRENKGKVVIV